MSKFSDFPGVSSDLIIKEIPGAEHISSEEISKLYKHKNAVIPFMGCKDPICIPVSSGLISNIPFMLKPLFSKAE